MDIPSSVNIPSEMNLGKVDFQIPHGSVSRQSKIPSSVSSISSTFTPTNTATTFFGDSIIFPQTQLIFDIPCAQSPSTMLDHRFTTLNWTANITFSSAGTINTGTFYDCYLRDSGYSYFDNIRVVSQNGADVENIPELGLTMSTLIATQLDNAVRHGLSTQYGFDSASSTFLGSQGHKWSLLSAANITPATTQTETHSYSVPLPSSLIGCLAEKMFNIGRTAKLQVILTPASVFPITGGINGVWTAAPTITITLSNFFIQCEFIDIGLQGLKLLDETLINGKAYYHGVTYKTTTGAITASAGSQTVIAGIRGSSLKSLFTRFVQGGTASATNSVNGKYDSSLPLINSINYNIGGVRYPQYVVNPLLQPAVCLRNLQLAVGSWNNSLFTSSIPTAQYCKLSAGGSVAGTTYTVGATTASEWNLGSTVSQLNQFIYGENLEVIMKRGLFSGLDTSTSGTVSVEMTLASAPTNTHTLYVTGMFDIVYTHDVQTGDVVSRM